MLKSKKTDLRNRDLKMSTVTMELIGPSKKKKQDQGNQLLVLGFIIGAFCVAVLLSIIYFLNLVPGAALESQQAEALLQPPAAPANRFKTAISANSGAQLEAEESPGFSRENDNDRARQFRQLNAREDHIEELLRQAQELMQEGKIYTAAEPNALELYHQVLAIDGDHRKARSGIREIAENVGREIESRFADTDYTAAQKLVDQLWVIDPGATVSALQQELIELRISQALQKQNEALTSDRVRQQQDETQKQEEQIATKAEEQKKQKTVTETRRKKLNQLLTRADRAFEAGRLTTPAGKNALYYYQQVEKEYGENSEAQAGVDRISFYILQLANQEILAGRLEIAGQYLDQVRQFDPKNPTRGFLQQQLEKQRQFLALEQARKKEIEEARASLAMASQRETVIPVVVPPVVVPVEPEPPVVEAVKNQGRAELELGVKSYYDAAYETAFRYLLPLADQGETRAQFRIGIMYYTGRGVAKNRGTGEDWLNRALPGIQQLANQGVAWAQSDLATLYEEGLLLAKKPAEAIAWYRKAAAQDYVGALTNLGVMYANGIGVSRDRDAAIRYLQQAAELGDRIARENLEVLGTAGNINPLEK